ncbi:hypothetical protein pb186bvf_003438 [Paramecium bursaria]
MLQLRGKPSILEQQQKWTYVYNNRQILQDDMENLLYSDFIKYGVVKSYETEFLLLQCNLDGPLIQIIFEWICDGYNPPQLKQLSDVMMNELQNILCQRQLPNNIVFQKVFEYKKTEFTNLVLEHVVHPRIVDKISNFLSKMYQYITPQPQYCEQIHEQFQACFNQNINSILFNLDKIGCANDIRNIQNQLIESVFLYNDLDGKDEDYYIKRLQYFNQNKLIDLDKIKIQLYEYLMLDTPVYHKKFITLAILILRLHNDTILQLSLTEADNFLQIQNPLQFCQLWVRPQRQQVELWNAFSTLTQQNQLKLENYQFRASNPSTQKGIRIMFQLAQNDCSEFIIKSTINQSLLKYNDDLEIYTSAFNMFKIDIKQIQSEQMNQWIFKAILNILFQLEQKLSEQEALRIKVNLCQFCIQCMGEEMPSPIWEQNICGFLQQILNSKQQQLLTSLVQQGFSRQPISQIIINKVVQSVESFHIIINDLSRITQRHHNKMFMFQLATALKARYHIKAMNDQFQAICNITRFDQPKKNPFDFLNQKCIGNYEIVL